MTQSPFDSEPVLPPVQPYASGTIWPVRTSGFAIASLACGIVGLLSFCLFLPSVLSIVFGGVALPAIKAGQARGKGLAVSGIITGITGVLLGLVLWIVFLSSPDTVVVKGSLVSTSDIEKLRLMGALLEDERIEYLCPTGMFSVVESGLILTAERLVVYDDQSVPESCKLSDIAAIEYTPAANWIDDAVFIIELDNGDELYFMISTEWGGDRVFERQLRRMVTKARTAAGRPAPESELTPLEPDSDE